MQRGPRYGDVVAEVRAFLAERVAAAEARGIARERIVIDPGFGFGKTVEHNFELLRNLRRFAEMGLPVMAGGRASRPSVRSPAAPPVIGLLQASPRLCWRFSTELQSFACTTWRRREMRFAVLAAMNGHGAAENNDQKVFRNGRRARESRRDADHAGIRHAARLCRRRGADAAIDDAGGRTPGGADRQGHAHLGVTCSRPRLKPDSPPRAWDVMLNRTAADPRDRLFDPGSAIAGRGGDQRFRTTRIRTTASSFFSAEGSKLPDGVEMDIETRLDRPMHCKDSASLGKARRVEDARGRYIEFCKSTFPSSLDLRGMKIVIDCAHGATYHVAPHVFHELGADVETIGADPDGFNINDRAGTVHPEVLQRAIAEHKADLGIGSWGRDPSSSSAMPRSALCSAIARCRTSGCTVPARSLMLNPSGSAPIVSTSAPSSWNTWGAT